MVALFLLRFLVSIETFEIFKTLNTEETVSLSFQCFPNTDIERTSNRLHTYF